MNERKTKGLTNLNSDEKIIGTLVCPWPECIFRSLLQFLVLSLDKKKKLIVSFVIVIMIMLYFRQETSQL